MSNNQELSDKLHDELVKLSKDCIAKHHLPTARFYADKACTISNYHHCDVYILAKIHFLNKEYHRSIAILQKYGLIPYANHMGVNDVSFIQQNETLLLTMDENKNNENKNNDKSKNNENNDISKEDKLSYLLLGMQSFLECGEYESCISMLSESDDIALQFIQPELILNKHSSSNNHDKTEINLSSLLCMIRAKALEKLSIDQRALWWFEKSLIFDCKNIQVFVFFKRLINK